MSIRKVVISAVVATVGIAAAVYVVRKQQSDVVEVVVEAADEQ